MRARIAIDGETVAIAARQMGDADIEELKRILQTMDPGLKAQESYLPADRAFHLYVAEKAGNSVLVRFVAELFDARHSPLSLQFGKHFENVSTRKEAVAERKAIVKALASRNPEAAKQAMQRHLRNAHNRLTKQVEGDTRKGPKPSRTLKNKRPQPTDRKAASPTLDLSPPSL